MPASVLERLRRRVAALSPKEQSRFKEISLDVHGARHQIRYNSMTGCFMERVDARVRASSSGYIPDDGWVPICPKETLIAMGVRSSNPFQEAAFQQGGFAACLAHHAAQIDANHTGKHKGKTPKIAVPTAAGQPVRG